MAGGDEADDIRAVVMVVTPPGLPLGGVSAETQDVPLRSGTCKEGVLDLSRRDWMFFHLKKEKELASIFGNNGSCFSLMVVADWQWR